MQDKYWLSTGSHSASKDGRCALEWVAYLAGEPHSDSPACVCPTLTRFCVAFNDGLPDGPRQRLRPYLARTIGTRGDGLAAERSWMAMDWLVRTYAPTWLALAGLDEAAERLRALPPVLAVENLTRAMDDLNFGRRQAVAAWDAAWVAAGVAAWDAAGDAAWVAAGVAAGVAAWVAAGVAAWDAAGDAAGVAAWDAAGVALAPAVSDLQESAFALLDRMLPTVPLVLPVAVDAEAVCAA